MKTQLFVTAIIALLAGQVQAQDKTPVFKDEREKVGYSLGMNMAGVWKRNEVDVDADMVGKAIKDVLTGAQTLLTEKEAQETLMKYQKELLAKREEKRKQDAEKNKTAGETFLAENKTKPGIVALPSGLQYKVITSGNGQMPKADDVVMVNYRGTLLDGTEFDSSYKRGEPATFRVGGVIKGWQEALELMPTGSKWQLFIPSELAYRDVVGPQRIGPNSTLIFEIELLSIKPPTANAAQPVTSEVIKVPSAEELKKGAKPETLSADQVQKEIEKAKK